MCIFSINNYKKNPIKIVLKMGTSTFLKSGRLYKGRG